MKERTVSSMHSPRRSPLHVTGVVLVLVSSGRLSAQDIPRKADLIITNAKIWTGSARPNDPEPTAIAIIGDSIADLGDAFTLTRDRLGKDTKMLDANGRRIIPGMTDSHTHLIGGGFQLVRLNLRDAKNRDEFVKAVETDAKQKKPGEWVLGGRWSVDSWADASPPRASWLDPVTGNTPVFLNRMDGHEALVNFAALKLAGIDAKGPPDPAGGEIERDPKTKEPTGILKESAMDLVEKLIPEPTSKERYEALLRAMRHANSLGVTSAHDMSQLSDLDAFRQAGKERALTLRITSYLSTEDWSKYADQIAKDHMGLNDKFLYLAGFKGYMDGSLGSRTAYMHEPFSDSSPESRYPRGQLTAFAAKNDPFVEQVTAADAKGLQLAVHAIGDEANHLLLNAYEVAAKANNTTDMRNRVEHAQHLLVEDIPRFAKLGVVASMQPLHKADDARYAEKALGSDRLQGSYAYRQLLDTRALLIFGSDWPVVSMNPFEGIASAVTAKTVEGKTWLPEHSIKVQEAVAAYTVWPPRAIHREATLGLIEPGKLADLVILKDDPFIVSPDKLDRVRVAQTIVGGKIVYTAPE
jgi:predicted amidohydrolase YtcJ